LRPSPWFIRYAVVATLFSLVACGSSEPVALSVRLVTDFVPGPEVVRVQSRLSESVSGRELGRVAMDVAFGDPTVRGLHVADFVGLEAGAYDVRVELFAPDGSTLASRLVRADVAFSRELLVHVTRACVAVVCPGAGGSSESSCLAGRCVDSRCTPEDRTHCPNEEETFCNFDDDCAAGSAACSTARCDRGVCVVEEREGTCGTTEWCAPTIGCAPVDMPVSPKGPDERCGLICRLDDAPCVYGFSQCTPLPDGTVRVDCMPLVARPVGSPCGEGLVCDARRECDEPVIEEPCAAGFERVSGVCVDVDECVPLGASACGGAGTCVNTAGSYTCECPSGYAGTGTTSCTDVDECETLTPCDAAVACTNTPGGFTCGDCPAGFGGGGASGCVDIDECASGLDACGTGSCTDLDGSYTCTCPSGFVGTGTTSCEDINECAATTGLCGAGACGNTLGSFECTCAPGYVGGGTTACTDVDECATNNGGCDPLTTCTNTPGSRSCGACPAGYAGDGIGGCADVDECLELRDACEPSEVCVNEVASYRCFAVPPATVSVGIGFGCAILRDGAVECWGTNDQSRAGASGPPTVTPLPVSASGAVSIASGVAHSCVLTADSEVACWGGNDSGALGSGTRELSSTFERVAMPEAFRGRVVKVESGKYFSCALSSLGEVTCWGSNSNGKLGLPGVTDNLPAPIDVVALPSPAVDIELGSHFVCALLGDGTLSCWGSNSLGNFGNGENLDLDAPSPPIAWPFAIKRLAAGFGHVCALGEGGEVYCSGYNDDGQLGDGSTRSRNTPEPIVGIGTGVDDIVAEGAGSCALARGVVYCWGSNSSGQLGIGERDVRFRVSPEAVSLPQLAVFVEMSDRTTCAGLVDGSLMCWGSGEDYGLGLGDTYDRPRPDTGGILFDRDIVVAATGIATTCVVLDDGDGDRTPDGELYCWGDDAGGQVGYGTGDISDAPPSAPVLRDVTRVSTSATAARSLTDAHTCAVSSGEVYCWGRNESGQLGLGDFAGRTTPTSAVSRPFAGTYVDVCTGGQFTCALGSSGKLACWGANDNGQLGVGDLTNRPSPTAASSDGFSAIACGGYHVCGIRADGSILCWGHNEDGQLGVDTGGVDVISSSLAVPVPFAAGAEQLALGALHSCAKIRGQVSCWGKNTGGHLFDPSVSVAVPPITMTAFNDLGLIVDVSAGNSHNCVTYDDNRSMCWGDGATGQLGDGLSSDRREPGDVVRFGGPIARVVSGFQTNCAVSDRELACWGSNSGGQLGYGFSPPPGRDSLSAPRAPRVIEFGAPSAWTP
jgi:alpha-tubulin suppressor-like RCC1 family protein